MATPDLSLMVIPNSTGVDPMPVILVDHRGVWRDMSAGSILANPATAIRKKVNENLDDLSKVIEKKEPYPAAHISLTTMFKDFYDLIVPSKVQEMIEKAAQAAEAAGVRPALRIHTQTSNDWIPWEILYDGAGYLGLRFEITRLPIVPHVLDAGDGQPHQVQNVYSLLAKNVLDDDPALRGIWEGTFDGLFTPPAAAQRFPPPEDAQAYPDVQRMADSSRNADILHIMCHGIKDEQDSVYWTLDHRSTVPTLYRITSRLVNQLVFKTRPLIFGNGCASSGAGGGNQDLSQRGLLPPAMGASFFSRGALNFVGTFAPVSRTIALEFARGFYVNLLGQSGQVGLPIGQALWKTKKDFWDAARADPSYLFYCLYGPPDTAYRQ